MPSSRIRCEAGAARRKALEASGRQRVISCVPIAGQPGMCLLTWEAVARDRAPRVAKLAGVPGVSGRVEYSAARAVPRRFFELETKASRAAPRAIAQALVRKLAPRLGIAPDLSQLRYDRAKRTLLGHHVLFQQQHAGKPVSGAWLRVDIAPDGRVYNIQSDLIPSKLVKQGDAESRRQRAPEAKPLTRRSALAYAFKAAPVDPGGKREVLHAELMFGTQFSRPRLTWKIVVHTTRPSAEWKLYLDAYSGAVITRQDVLKRAAARGRVFDPSPVATLGDSTLTEHSEIPAAAYFDVLLPDVALSGYLDGPYVSTSNTRQRVRSRNRRFDYVRGQRGFLEVMAYFHIDRVQRYLRRIGFEGVLDQPIKVNVTALKDDNSFYSPARKSLSFGTGGVDDAEDADIIVHEYGHAIQDAQLPGFGETIEAGAMGEGFGDYLAASVHAELKPARMRPTFANWDATSWSEDDPPCVRRLDSVKRYPRNVRHEVHADGEIWSACLWQLRQALGRRVADRLVVAHHFLLNRRARFEDAANALLTVDRQLHAGVHGAEIRRIFVARGILGAPAKAVRRRQRGSRR